jgi:hypothetical protein
MAKYQIKAPNGETFEVTAPDDAPIEKVLEYAKQNYQTAKPPERTMSRGESFEYGLGDPIYGAMQLGAHVLSGMSVQPDDPLAKGQAGATARLAPAADKIVREREERYEKKRGKDQGFDWWRLGGNVANPVNYLPVGGEVVEGGRALVKGTEMAGEAATKLGLIGKGAVTGAKGGAGGALAQPVNTTNNQDYWRHKATDTAIGAAFGIPIGAAGGGLSAGVRAIGEALVKNYPESRTIQAVREIMQRLNQDAKSSGVRASDLAKLVYELQQKGIPVTLADVAGENTEALLGHVARQPGGTYFRPFKSGPRKGQMKEETGESRNFVKNFLDERDAGVATRIEGYIDEHLYGGANAHFTEKLLTTARARDSAGAYEQLKDVVVSSDRLQQFLNDPKIQAAIEEGIEQERLRALASGVVFNPGDVRANPKQPTLYALNVAKQGFDRQVEKNRDTLGRLTPDGVTWDMIRRGFLKAVDEADVNGYFKIARDKWGGPSASLDALKLGGSIFEKWDPSEFAEKLESLSESDKEFARLGAASALKVKMLWSGVNSDETKQIFGTEGLRRILAPLFPERADFEGFAEKIQYEQRIFETRVGAIRGSPTGRRMMEDQSFAAANIVTTANMAHALASGNTLGVVQHAVKIWRDRQMGKIDPGVNEEIAKILLNADFGQFEKVFKNLLGSKAKRFALPTSARAKAATKMENTVGLATQPFTVGAGASEAMQNEQPWNVGP